MKFIRPEPNFFILSMCQRIKITYKIAAWRLRLELGHLGDYKFRHNFQYCVPPMRSCGQDIETATHLLLHCPNHHCARRTLFHKINQVSGIISRQNNFTFTKILLYGDNKLDFETNEILLMSTIEFILLTERFSCRLFQ